MTIDDLIGKSPAADLVYVAIVFTGLIGITLLIYWPGLNSPFMFDDFANLRPLGTQQNADTYSRLIQFVFSGNSGPGGRPLSLASMLLNDYAWPSQPRSFKYTNVLIHILNGVLIFWLALKLITLIKPDFRQAHWAALLCAAIWLLHPLQLSTVLYVIQRMTQLATLFTVAALLVFIHGRSLIDTRPLKGYIIISTAILIGGTLAILSKESGILLVIYALVLELFLLGHYRPIQQRWWKYWLWGFLGLPIVMMALYIIVQWDHYQLVYSWRPFDLWQRLFTEARIVVYYLYDILIPKIGGNGLYHDDLVISDGLFKPFSTVACMTGILGLALFGWRLRHVYPLFSFAIFWFFGAHVLESTVLPLELYFEHRNYLAIFGIAFAVVLASALAPGHVDLQGLRKYSVSLLGAGVIVCAGFTGYNAYLWSHPVIAAFVWAEEHPRSVRAIQDAAINAMKLNKPELALKQLEIGLQHHPTDAGLLMHRYIMTCYAGKASAEEASELHTNLKTAAFSFAALHSVVNLTEKIPIKECPAIDFAMIIEIIQGLLDNPNFGNNETQHLLYYKLSEMYVQQRNLNNVIVTLDKSFSFKPVPQIPIQQATLLLSAGLDQDALRYLRLARETNNRQHNIFLRRIQAKDIDILETYALAPPEERKRKIVLGN